ncbi:transcriptional regulator, TetR family [Mycolicibacterium chubuense NBB4]|uniref:Transcriptional regulator, TetR family n=1 Tax=Mycolicibacterium chubuense (strain NBB4) TaxID=710421 RepID=I4BQQ4_MYCCN|nr:TetR/AcrR family transcriptional regulator [Mycolicibacterium chubuense]AFM19611.1 transcriptional regulator, TetR family [Mycolicibacterium chubuense NBB4]
MNSPARDLLEVAARVLADDPSASMADIAGAGGVGRATAWRHLGSREQLLSELYARSLSATRKALARTLGAEPLVTPEVVVDVVQALGAIGDRYRALRQLRPLDDTARREVAAVMRPLRDGFVRGQAAGRVRADITPELGVSLVAGVVAAALDPRTGASDPARAVRDAARVLADGLRTEPGRGTR